MLMPVGKVIVILSLAVNKQTRNLWLQKNFEFLHQMKHSNACMALHVVLFCCI